jgi:hypothetical protein
MNAEPRAFVSLEVPLNEALAYVRRVDPKQYEPAQWIDVAAEHGADVPEAISVLMASIAGAPETPDIQRHAWPAKGELF